MGLDSCRAGIDAVILVASGLLRILNRDLNLAGVPKVAERGRTVDIHGLRHTFGTHLSKGGVTPRTAQAAMRHSSVDLTMNVYTDPKLLDVHGALDVLPRLPLDGGSHKRERATGTEGGPRQFAAGFAPNSGTDRQSGANADNQGRGENESGRECFSPVNPDDVKGGCDFPVHNDILKPAGNSNCRWTTSIPSPGSFLPFIEAFFLYPCGRPAPPAGNHLVPAKITL